MTAHGSAANAEPLFTDEDLAANRRGELTERQRGWLREARRSKLLPETGIFLVGMVLMVIGFINPTSFDFSICLPVGVIVAIYAIYLMVLNWRKFSTDLSSGQVSVISGFARPVRSAQRQQASNWIEIGNMRFVVSAELFQTFSPGHYHAYYAPNAMLLLSLEPLSE